MVFNVLGTSILAAFAIAFTVYAETGSFLLSFLAYSATGSLVLLGVIASAWLDERAADETQVAYPAE